jgi:cytochrome c biogenesis protein CcdA/thioredoxin-related protein
MLWNKRRPLTVILFFLVALQVRVANAQDSTAFQWSVKSEKTGQGEYILRFSSPIRNNWQLYAPGQDLSGISAAQLGFQDSSIIISTPLGANGTLTPFRSPLFDNAIFNVQTGSADWLALIRISGEVPASLFGTLQYTYGKGDEFYPLESFAFEVPLEGGRNSGDRILIGGMDIQKPTRDCGVAPSGFSGNGPARSLWSIFFLGFLGGLVALLTPCVFPMVPLTVSFFTKRSSEQKGTLDAMLYGFFIFLIYVSFSIPFHLIGKVSPTIYNDISTNVWLNLAFFIIFIAFAVSFFGFYEITLPSGLANKANARQGSNLFGIFFMALTLAIVSFSCTGPILGTLLVGTASEGAWPLTAGLAGFGAALGLPFALFAMFPQWLQSLPRSGGWLNTVKVVLGFLELALALKFLSNADLVAHWGILPREWFFAIWVLIGLGLFLYLMGWLRFPHDTPGEKIGWVRKILALAVLAFTIYLAPGVTNTKAANLSLVSGFPPPACYSVYANPVNCEEPLKDYDEALTAAREKGKPILIDFTGWACVNCRKMEENVWTDARVKELMQQYVLVSLYVDDKAKLPAGRQFMYTAKDGSRRKIVTVGDKWSTFQTENFSASSQPWYVVLSPDETLLTPPVGYMPDPATFAAWLACGLDMGNR